ncbi:hypothetical protein WISP_70238 [Willisornis vidua]|uniref:Ig-like domain-containing protein n=1 Tax=Willisornis vidua TaxID=1566151 RepID=A0ABQ9DAG1_9PASS|nr:hypothetical protein WISP_70238 [Willisornis vidua]
MAGDTTMAGNVVLLLWVYTGSLFLPISFLKLLPVPVLEVSLEVTEGSSLNLRCLSCPSTLKTQGCFQHLFYHDGVVVGIPQVHLLPCNATITPGSPSLQVWEGYNPMTLRCLVQVGSAPVTFTWLWPGQEVAWGPVLALRDVKPGHSGTYQCMAINHVFQVLSPELVLVVTLW